MRPRLASRGAVQFEMPSREGDVALSLIHISVLTASSNGDAGALRRAVQELVRPTSAVIPAIPIKNYSDSWQIQLIILTIVLSFYGYIT